MGQVYRFKANPTLWAFSGQVKSEKAARSEPTPAKGDAMNWSEEKDSVAHHEAGHWVMSHVLGCPLDDVGLFFDETEKSWRGSTNSQKTRKDFDPDKGIRIAFAGPWAEIFFQARKTFPDCNLDTSHEAGILVDLVLNDDDANDNYDCPTKLEVPLSLSNGITETLFIDYDAFSDDGLNARAFAKEDKTKIKMGLLDTRLSVNKLWPGIEALAKELLNRIDNAQQIVLSSTDAASIVKLAETATGRERS